jgi:hypothetical protein
MTDKCAKCGHPRKEHSYNGACYGLCGEFVECSSADIWVRPLATIHEGEIERVALAIERSMFAPHELPLTAELHLKYRATAIAAISVMPMPNVAQSSADPAVLRDALKNMMGAYDTPLSRRRFPPDEFMQAALESGRAALAAHPPAAPVETEVGIPFESVEAAKSYVEASFEHPGCSAEQPKDEQTCHDCGAREPCDEDCPNHVEPEPVQSCSAGTAKALDDLEIFIGEVDGSEAAEGGTIDGTEAIEALNALRAAFAQPQTVQVTDAMCEAAIDADAPDRIQGFSYKSRHVIRDVWADQEIWSAPVAGPDEYQAFQRQCRIERMRKTLEAALTVTRHTNCPNGLEHGACLHPECVPSCPGRLSLSRPHGGGQ